MEETKEQTLLLQFGVLLGYSLLPLLLKERREEGCGLQWHRIMTGMTATNGVMTLWAMSFLSFLSKAGEVT